MSTQFIDDLGRLAETIRAHPWLELLDHTVRPPDAAAIARVESHLGMKLPASIRGFYQQLNGASLQWRFRSDLPDAVKEQVRSEFQALAPAPDSLFQIAGNIQLLAVEDAFINEEYALPQNEEVVGTFDFDGKTYSDNEFSRMLRPFDVFEEFFCMAIVVQPGVADWKLMLLSDYWIEYDHSRVTWLDGYLEFLIATWGIRMARVKTFSKYRGDLEPPVQFDANAAASLVPALLKTS